MDEGEGEKVVVLGGEKSAKGGSAGGPWRVMRRGLLGPCARGRERERERLRRARCAEGAWARIERERGRQRQIPCLTRLGSMRSSARTPRRPRPSFLPSFSLLRSSLPSPCYLTLSFSYSVSVFLYSCLSFRLPFTLSLSLPLFFVVLRVPLFPSLSLFFSRSRSFSRVSSSVLSRRAADADAGASGIAATVGAAAHPSPSTPVPPSPLRPSAPLYPFRKAASLAVGTTHTPLTALHNACNPPHPLQPAQPTRRPTDCHPSPPPATLRPPPHGPLLPRCLFDPLPLVTTHRVHTHTHVFTHASRARARAHTRTFTRTYMTRALTRAFLCTHVYLVYEVTRTYLLFPAVASPLLASLPPPITLSLLLSLSLCRVLFSYPASPYACPLLASLGPFGISRPSLALS